jgi:hypothetical protein
MAMGARVLLEKVLLQHRHLITTRKPFVVVISPLIAFTPKILLDHFFTLVVSYSALITKEVNNASKLARQRPTKEREALVCSQCFLHEARLAS